MSLPRSYRHQPANLNHTLFQRIKTTPSNRSRAPIFINPIISRGGQVYFRRTARERYRGATLPGLISRIGAVFTVRGYRAWSLLPRNDPDWYNKNC